MALPRVSIVIGLCAALSIAVACEDPIVPLTADNNVTVTNQPGLFRFYANNLNNVLADTAFIWVSADSQAKVLHRSLVTHGEADMLVRDANGVIIATSPLAYEVDSLTSKGAPGPWTIEFHIKAATGKIDVTVETP